MYQYPYGNAQQLNLDWLMEQWQEVKQSIDGSLQGEIDRVEAAITDLLAARDAAVAAAGAANTSAGAAAQSAQSAAADAATATAQAAAATQERVNAAQAANNAQSYAGTAQTQAAAAQNAAGQAAASASQAAASAASASTSALTASGAATNAAASATAAQNAFTLADAARVAAQDAAQDAEEAAEALETAAVIKTIENVSIASFDDGVDAAVKSLVVDIYPVQSGSGDPSPTNVRPITGHTGANVTRINKNLIKFPYRYDTRTLNGVTFTVSDDGTITVTGTPTDTASFALVTPQNNPELKKLNGKRVTLSGCPSGGSTNTYYLNGFRVRNNGEASATDTGNTNSFIWSIGTLDFNISINIKVGTVIPEGGLIFKPQLEVADSATTYERYQATTISITFPTEAGTVYGGTLDVTTGVLTVDKTIVDMGSLSYTYDSTNDFFHVTPSGIGTPIASIAEEVCSTYKINTGISDSAMATAETGIYLVLSNGKHKIKDTRYSSGADLATALTGQKLIYPLATPTTYNLTPQEIAMLLGENNLWADTGNINLLQYYADSKKYIDEQDTLVKALIAPVLDDMVADTALTANDFRIVDNTLYRITTSVAAGAALTPNTNCTATTIGAILKTLLT